MAYSSCVVHRNPAIWLGADRLIASPYPFAKYFLSMGVCVRERERERGRERGWRRGEREGRGERGRGERERREGEEILECVKSTCTHR